jgi:hypothetical protein
MSGQDECCANEAKENALHVIDRLLRTAECFVPALGERFYEPHDREQITGFSRGSYRLFSASDQLHVSAGRPFEPSQITQRQTSVFLCVASGD